MAWVVAAIGVTSFLAGLFTAGGNYIVGGWSVAVAFGLSLWLRWYVVTSIDDAFERGAGYGISTRRRIRLLPEAHDVPAAWKHNNASPAD